jgi:1-acyl-sn-glycerol-3-phosphate acyltransferase
VRHFLINHHFIPEHTLVHTRSFLFLAAFAIWSTLIIAGALPFAVAPARTSGWWFRNWNRGTIALLRLICGIRVEVRGRENIPVGGGLIAAKHQCMFDAFTPYTQLPQPCVVTKQELAKLPFLGWFAAKGDLTLVVDREGHSKALRQLLEKGKKALADGRQILIFPEGTRSPLGAAPDYKPGVAALYSSLGVACTPMATNAGAHWLAGSNLKKPGTIVFDYLEPIPPDLPRAEFMRVLEERIETATNALLTSGV